MGSQYKGEIGKVWANSKTIALVMFLAGVGIDL
jgi:hypothetical protein